MLGLVGDGSGRVFLLLGLEDLGGDVFEGGLSVHCAFSYFILEGWDAAWWTTISRHLFSHHILIMICL